VDGRGLRHDACRLCRKDVRWLAPYRQLEQSLFRPEGVVGLLFRNGTPGTPEFDRIYIVGDEAFKDIKNNFVLWPPDCIVRDLSIPASMKKSLDESDR